MIRDDASRYVLTRFVDPWCDKANIDKIQVTEYVPNLLPVLDTMYDEISSYKIFQIEFPIGSR